MRGIALVLLLVGVGGCGAQSLRVEGLVTWDGKPVDGGSISLVPVEQPERAFGVQIDKNGTFRLESPRDLAPGAYIVRIWAARKTGTMAMVRNADQVLVRDERVEQSPDRYHTQDDQIVMLKAGELNRLQFDLQGEAAPR